MEGTARACHVNVYRDSHPPKERKKKKKKRIKSSVYQPPPLSLPTVIFHRHTPTVTSSSVFPPSDYNHMANKSCSLRLFLNFLFHSAIIFFNAGKSNQSLNPEGKKKKEEEEEKKGRHREKAVIETAMEVVVVE